MLANKSQLARFFKAIADLETSVEKYRASLAKNPDFDAYKAFTTLDSSRTGSIALNDLCSFLKLNNYSGNEAEVSFLYDLYNSNHDGKLSYSDFLNLVLSANFELRQSATNYQSSYFTKSLTKDVKWELVQLLETEITGLKLINEMAEDLRQSSDWDVKAAFNTVDTDRRGYIDRVALNDFFKKTDLMMDKEDISALIKRIDRDHDGRLNYNEFMQTLYPAGCLNHAITDHYAQTFSFTFSPSQDQDQTFKTSSSFYSRRYWDEFVEKLVGRQKRSSHRGRNRREDVDEISKVVDMCLLRSLENRIRSMRSSSPPPLDRDFNSTGRFRTIFDGSYNESAKALTGSRFFSPERSHYSTRFYSTYNSPFAKSDTKDRPRYNKLALEKLVDDILRKSAKARARSQSPPKQESSINRPHSTNAGVRTPTKGEEVKQDAQASDNSQFMTPEKKTNLKEKKEQLKLSPMKGQEEHCFIKALQEIIELDQAVEDYREKLALSDDFTPYTAYSTILDAEGTSTCDIYKLQEVFASSEIKVDRAQLERVFERFDKDADGNIDEKDFEEMVYPKDKALAGSLSKKEDQDELSEETREILYEFFEKIIEVEAKVEEIRKRLSKRSLFDLEEAFRCLDAENRGHIEQEQFQKLFEKYNIRVNAKQLENLIQRYDMDFDGKVSQQEFCQGMTPSH